jgi:hypothetical protein
MLLCRAIFFAWYNLCRAHEALGGGGSGNGSRSYEQALDDPHSSRGDGAMSERDAFHRQVAAYKRIEEAWRKIQELHWAATEEYGVSLDSDSTDDRFAVDDELRALHIQLNDATDEFIAACDAFDDVKKPISLSRSVPK